MNGTEHQRIYELLLSQIRSGEYAEGSHLPAERKLCELFGVSRVTVRQALQDLKNNGFIAREQGRGTYVKPSVIEQPLDSLYSFSEELMRQHLTPGTRLLSLTTVPAQGHIAAALKLEEDIPVRCLCRLRLANEIPYAYETGYIPLDVLGNATPEDICRDGLYNTMKRNANIRVESATEVFAAVLAPPHVVEHLGRKGILSVMQLERTAYCGNRPVEYCESFVCGDKFSFRITLHR